MLHAFSTPIEKFELPKTFVNPFCDKPHPICMAAAHEVENYLKKQTNWHEELNKGKMLGVLVVRTKEGTIRFLAAFSGLLAGKNYHPYFVPPVFDFLQPDHYFKKEVARISAINEVVTRMEQEIDVTNLKEEAKKKEVEKQTELATAKAILKEEKKRRSEIRKSKILTPEEEAGLIVESQRQKGAYTRLERALKEQILTIKSELESQIAPLESLKQERKTRSGALQEYLFKSFKFLNKEGEKKALYDIFRESPLKTPPAGAGECAGPKLLQYAYLNNLAPIAMAEFWWGESPKQEIRHHGYFYAPCKGKCEPIFGHMLTGWELKQGNIPQETTSVALRIIYEDADMVAIHKPAGLLSVPGKEPNYSAYQWMRENYPQASGPLIVHRLDMATSGILLLAKNKEMHKLLQELFTTRKIKKRYVALLEANTLQQELPQTGEIELPILLNILDRPRQMVDKINGKHAYTAYELLGCEIRTIQDKTKSQFTLAPTAIEKEESKLDTRDVKVMRVHLYPHTGRTHQLRVHAAHPEGLNAPILGDALYGKIADRLYLHAEQLDFTHPLTKEKITLIDPAEF